MHLKTTLWYCIPRETFAMAPQVLIVIMFVRFKLIQQTSVHKLADKMRVLPQTATRLSVNPRPPSEFMPTQRCVSIHTYTNPRGRLKWPCAITRLTTHFMCGLMSDLVICKFRKSMVIHDAECPHWDQVSLDNTNQPTTMWQNYTTTYIIASQPPLREYCSLHSLFTSCITLCPVSISQHLEFENGLQ